MASDNEIPKLDIVQIVKILSNDYTSIISRDILKSYPGLNWGNNGIGSRWANSKFNYSVIYGNGKIKTYSDNNENIDLVIVKDFCEKQKGSGIIGILPHSRKLKDPHQNRPIRKDILDKIKSGCCVVCGSKSELVCDHKNDLYNDLRVLDAKTQVLDDFQCLCNHCNLQKRQVAKKTRETGKRYGATNIPQFNKYGIDFTEGDETFDPDNPDAMVGTYWYDPVEFIKKIIATQKLKLLLI